jgi:gas vesicle protein
MKSLSSFMAGLLAGAVVGGAVALLYAPQSGKETRDQIKRKFEDLEKELEALKGKASAKTDKVREDLASRLADLQREVENLSKEV